ncbi:probable serine/threonine-protein kinase PBL7 [Sesamum indicum]|uniref:Probable serine/threonine-protein kinase PBL7 n=1 Tax=Sesamum indicum TaxID=4182 RepID=A0A6I9TMN5_SESIN|nr:probable serine/threonine-protein kinase PBL7 [Sesamum indicum]
MPIRKIHQDLQIDISGPKSGCCCYADGTAADLEFITEILVLNCRYHPNVMELMGFFAGADIVYEFTPFHSLQDHLHSMV